MIKVIITFLFVVSCQVVLGQDTLPNFSVVAKPANKNLISWTNKYRYTSQISIQRSGDSLKNFKTILTVPDPSVLQNGLVDSRAPVGTNFYRLFIVLDSGKYLFTRAKRPAPDTAKVSGEPVLKNDNQRVVLSDSLSNPEVNAIKQKLQPATPATPKAEKFFIVKKRGLIVSKVAQRNMQRFRDSLVFSTKDTMVFAAVDTVVIKPFVPKEVYRASKYVYTEKFGNVAINLPDANTKKYSIQFFEEDKSPLFEIEDIRSTMLVVEKSNFLHAGWFWFELYEDGKLKERHKFQILRDF